MAVYVDSLIATQPYRQSANKRWNWSQSCHLMADTEEELHVFAKRLGLKRAWFQNHHPNPLFWHYDLTAKKRMQAFRLGAKELTPHQFTERLFPRQSTEQFANSLCRDVGHSWKTTLGGEYRLCDRTDCKAAERFSRGTWIPVERRTRRKRVTLEPVATLF
jgi:hypothetical protein